MYPRALRVTLLIGAIAFAMSLMPSLAAEKDAASSNNGSNASAGQGSNKSESKSPPGQLKKDVLPDTDIDATRVLPQVDADAALSLVELRAAVAALSAGRVLDVTLVSINGSWVYDVTVLEEGNIALHLFVDARTGLQVEH
jgi:uncharacterized membrane protein YkoI